MKKASVALTRAHLRLLNKGEAVTVRLPDAVVEIRIHSDARLMFSLDQVFAETQAVINKAKPCGGKREHR